MFNPETIPSKPGTDPTRAFKRYARCYLAEAKRHRSDAQAFDDPTPPPAHPFLYPTMSISEPGEAPTRDTAAQGSGLIGPVPRSVNVLFRPGFRHSSQAHGLAAKG